jgi:hypothetical protein
VEEFERVRDVLGGEILAVEAEVGGTSVTETENGIGFCGFSIEPVKTEPL